LNQPLYKYIGGISACTLLQFPMKHYQRLVLMVTPIAFQEFMVMPVEAESFEGR
jgi:enolase